MAKWDDLVSVCVCVINYNLFNTDFDLGFVWYDGEWALVSGGNKFLGICGGGCNYPNLLSFSWSSNPTVICRLPLLLLSNYLFSFNLLIKVPNFTLPTLTLNFKPLSTWSLRGLNFCHAFFRYVITICLSFFLSFWKFGMWSFLIIWFKLGYSILYNLYMALYSTE